MKRLAITGKTDAGTGFSEDVYNDVDVEILNAIIFCQHGYNRQVTIMGNGVNITIFSNLSILSV